MQMPTVRPYPWRALERTTREGAALLRDIRRWADSRWPLHALREAFRGVLGVPVDVIVRRVKPWAAAGDFGEGLGLLFANGDLAPADERILLQVEQALAADLVGRALQRPAASVIAERVSDPARRAAPLAGAFGAVVMAAARRAGAERGDGALRLVSAGEAGALAASTGWPEPERAVAVGLTVIAGDNAYSARAAFVRSSAHASASLVWRRPALVALGDARLVLRIVACSVEASAVDVAALRHGDVLVPGTMPIQRSRVGSWTGPVFLAASGSDVTVRAELAEGDRLVLRAGPAESAEESMAEHEASGALVEALGEIPVVVRVEIGRAEMRAREWAAIGDGDVIPLGQPVGHAVVLRVGSQVVARGELVDVDGEVGVRVLERLAAMTHARTMILVPLMLTALAAITACSKGPSDVSPTPAAEAHPDSASPSPVPVSAKDAAPAAASSAEWHGSYDSVPGTLYIAPQLKGVKWVVPDTDAGLGTGAIVLTVDHGTGRIRGTVEGPLGPALIDGYADGPSLSATVVRKDPTDRGFTGTLEAKQDDTGVSGTLHVALAEVSAVRTATFHLTSAPGAGSIAH